jgi:hypothetical protein
MTSQTKHYAAAFLLAAGLVATALLLAKSPVRSWIEAILYIAFGFVLASSLGVKVSSRQ